VRRGLVGNRNEWIGVVAVGLLLAAALGVGCSRDKRADSESGGSATAAPSAKGAATAKAGVQSPESKEKSDAGHPHSTGEAPHGHDEGGEVGGPAVTLTANERANIGLKTEEAAVRPFEDVLSLPGLMKAFPDRVAMVTSRTAGKIVDIHAGLPASAEGRGSIEVRAWRWAPARCCRPRASAHRDLARDRSHAGAQQAPPRAGDASATGRSWRRGSAPGKS
jgi:hypothetical protein